MEKRRKIKRNRRKEVITIRKVKKKKKKLIKYIEPRLDGKRLNVCILTIEKLRTGSGRDHRRFDK